MRVENKPGVVLFAERVTREMLGMGEYLVVISERDERLKAYEGDWLMFTYDDIKWPVSDELFQVLYEEVSS